METTAIVNSILSQTGVAVAVLMLLTALLCYAVKALWARLITVTDITTQQAQATTEAINGLTSVIERLHDDLVRRVN